MNTRIDYLYRDSENYKVYNSVIVPGTFTDAQKKAIVDSLDGDLFVPNAVGFPEKRFDYWDDESDSGCFEFCLFEETLDTRTIDLLPEEIVTAFQRNKGKWAQLATERFTELSQEWKEIANRPIPGSESKPKFGVLVAAQNEFCFVTKIYPNNYAEWLSGEPAKMWDSRCAAKEIASGLCANGTPAMVVEVPSNWAKLKNF